MEPIIFGGAFSLLGLFPGKKQNLISPVTSVEKARFNKQTLCTPQRKRASESSEPELFHSLLVKEYHKK